MSSHITSDLEKGANYIVFLRAGQVIFEKTKDELLYQFGILKCGARLFRFTHSFSLWVILVVPFLSIARIAREEL